MHKQLVLSLLIGATLCLAQPAAPPDAGTRYFPKGSFSSNAREDMELRTRFADALAALQEAPLTSERSTQSYRFLWLRSFHEPISIRIDVREDGTSTLTAKVGATPGSNERGALESRTERLSRAQSDLVIRGISSTAFWSLPAKTGRIGPDGAVWLVEGVRPKRHHAVFRWAPKSGPIREIGVDFLRLSKIAVEPDELY